MKLRTAKKIAQRWNLLPAHESRKWKKKTLERALDYWLYRRFLPHNVSVSAWSD